MKEDIDPEVLDAAIIASCQKVEHYEICSYGTLKAYAEELGLTQVVKLLDETLEEEYEADFLLTELAVFGGVNEEADTETGESNRAGASKTAADSRNGSLRESRASSPTAGSSGSSAGKSSGARKGTASAGRSTSSKSSSSSSSRKKTASSKK
jgi:rubrerythrin